MDDERIINARKKYSQLINKSKQQAKKKECLWCGKQITRFCNSHSVPQCVLRNIDEAGKLDYFNSIVNLPLINKDKGIAEAGTFKLVCPECDSRIFQDYEDIDKLNGNITERMLEEIALKNILMMLNKISPGTSDELMNAIFNVSKKNSTELANIRKAMGDVKKNIVNLNDITKDMAINVDRLFKATNVTKTLSYLNVGMTLANMAVDVAGFVIVCNKINELGGRMQELSEKIDKIVNLEKNKLIKDCRDFALDSNSWLEKMSLNEEINLDELERFINRYSNHLNMVTACFMDGSVDMEVLLTVINYLIPSYTLMVCEFLDRYYFKKGSMPANLESYVSLFDSLSTNAYISRLEDYFFFEEKLSTIDTMDAVNAQVLLGLNGRIQIEDQIEILKTLKTKKNVNAFNQKLEKYAKLKYEEDINELYNSSEKWKSEIETLRAS